MSADGHLRPVDGAEAVVVDAPADGQVPGPLPTAGRDSPLVSDGAPISRATVLDVARIAGVSGRTVSRVVAGGPNVSEQTRQRVTDAVRTLRFRPNRLARDLRTGGISTTVGFVVGDLTNPFYSQVAAGIERVLVDHGLTMLLAATRDDISLEPRTVGAVLEHRVRALLLVPIGEDHAYLDDERAHGTPIVAVDRPASNVDVDSVVFDNRGGAADGVRSLIAAGHRRIAFIGSDRTVYTHRERLAGYQRAVIDAGLASSPAWVRTDAPDAGSAERAAHELLERPDGPTAIFAGNNVAALGVIRALREHGKSIAFLAFDDFDLADTLAISVIAHDPGLMGSEAARLALSNQGTTNRPPTQLVLPTRLIRRGSGELPPSR